MVRVIRAGSARRPLPLRRSRGYVPAHLALPLPRGAAPAGLRRRAEEHLLRRQGLAGLGLAPRRRSGALLHAAGLPTRASPTSSGCSRWTPELVVHDLHPDYLSTAYALEREGVETVGVQHHHAHLAACLAEHAARGPGPRSDLRRHRLRHRRHRLGRRAADRRPARFRAGRARCGRCGCPVAPRPSASRGGWRSPGWPTRSGSRGPPPPRLERIVERRRWEAMAQIGASAGVSPLTSSMGRLFDAVGALCGLAAEVSYEGQAAVELEAAAWSAPSAAGVPDRAALEPGRPGAGSPRGHPRDRCATCNGGRSAHRGGRLSRRGGGGDGERAVSGSPASAGWRPPCSAAACSRTACCSRRWPPALSAPASGPDPRAPAAQRRRHLLRPGGGGGGPGGA